MKLTQRVLGMTPSLPRKLFDMAKEIGGDVIDLTLGDPDVPPPANVRAAACAAIEACQTRYSQNAGRWGPSSSSCSRSWNQATR